MIPFSIFSVPPQIVGSRTVSKISVIKGSTIALKCNVSGVPDPQITWIKDNSVIEISAHTNIRIVNDDKTLQVGLNVS